MSGHEEAIQLLRLAVQATPTSHPECGILFGKLGSLLGNRFQRTQQMTDLEEAIHFIRRSIQAIPTSHPDRSRLLDNLGTLLNDRFQRTGQMTDLEEAIRVTQLAIQATSASHPNHRNLLDKLGSTHSIRFQRTGQMRDLEEAFRLTQLAVKATPASHPDHGLLLNDLGTLHGYEYQMTKQMRDLEEAIRLVQLAVKATPANHSDYGRLLNNLGGLYGDRFERTLQKTDLEEAIRLIQTAVQATPASHINRGYILTNLGSLLGSQFLRTQQKIDIEEAIRITQAAVEATPTGHLIRAMLFSQLGAMFGELFGRLGRIEDLDEAIRLSQLAVQATPTDHPHRAGLLDSLGSLFRDRFLRTGQMADLDEAIRLSHVAVQTTSKDQPAYLTRLNNLGIRLADRFQRAAGGAADLDEGIRLVRVSVKGTPTDDPDRAERLFNLGSLLRSRYERIGQTEDLGESIQFAQLAVEATSTDDPNRAKRLDSLGIGLLTQFERTGQMEKLEKAIQLGQLAREATPADHPNYARFSDHLAHRLRVRFQRTGWMTDIDEAIRLMQLVVETTPEDQPLRATLFFHLGIHFQYRYSRTKQIKDLDESANAYLQSLHQHSGEPLTRIDAARGAASILAQRGKWQDASQILPEALDLVSKVTVRSSSRDDLQHTLKSLSGFASFTTSVLVKGGNSATQALQALEKGRAVIAGLMIDSRSDVSLLKAKQPTLWSHYNKLREEISILSFPELRKQSESALGEASDTVYVTRSSRRRQLFKELDEVEIEIRKQPGFERFQLAPTKQEILDLARYGPMVSFNIDLLGSYAFLVTETCIDCIELSSLRNRDVERMVSSFSSSGSQNRRDAVLLAGDSDLGSDEGQTKFDVQSELSWLWKDAVRPVLGKLGLLRQEKPPGRLPSVWWVGGGLMALAPLHVAGEHSPGSTENTLSHVVSSFAPSFKSLQFVRTKTWKPLKEQGHRILIVSMPTTPGCSGHLNVAEELTAIKGYIGARASITDLERPVKTQVLDEFRGCTIAHFACHGHSDASEPSKSALLLGRANQERLTIEDLDTVNHQGAQIAYLSACSTAEIKVRNLVDESIHLGSTFLLAGFPHTIATLWGAQDIAAVKVAGEFYKNLVQNDNGDNMSVAYALHDAISKLRAEGNTSTDVIKWGPFIHIGS